MLRTELVGATSKERVKRAQQKEAGGRPRERCSKLTCAAVQEDLRRVSAELRLARGELERERQQRSVLMTGDIRRLEVERKELKQVRLECRQAIKARTFSDKLVTSLVEDNRALVDIKAQLSAEISTLRSELAFNASTEVTRLRGEARDSRERERQVRRVREEGRAEGRRDAQNELAVASQRANAAEERAMRAEAAAEERVKAEQKMAELAISWKWSKRLKCDSGRRRQLHSLPKKRQPRHARKLSKRLRPQCRQRRHVTTRNGLASPV